MRQVSDTLECAPFRGVCHANAVSAVTHPDLVRLLGWQGIMKLRQASAALGEVLDYELLSRSIADDVGE